MYYVKISLSFAQCLGPFNFDVDQDPGSAVEKMDPDPDPGHFNKIY